MTLCENVFKTSSLWEDVFIEFHGGPLESKLAFCNIYRPPMHNNNSASIENFINHI